VVYKLGISRGSRFVRKTTWWANTRHRND